LEPELKSASLAINAEGGPQIDYSHYAYQSKDLFRLGARA
jgi:hypothetical protein